MIKVGILSLGCPRNLVDSEIMLGLLKRSGYKISDDIKLSDVGIVNTCAFIESAKRESIDAILDLIHLKKEGRPKVVIVSGCLVQRYKKKLFNELKEIDAFVGTGDYDKISSIIKKALSGKRVFEVNKPVFICNHATPRVFITPQHFSYLKISEGCSHRCSFCVIWRLRGRYRSRPIDSIVKEARQLSRKGVKEINLISQDSTFFGRDIYNQFRLADLLEELGRVNCIPWIRLLYAHPEHFSDTLIKVISDYPSICKYIDLPLQHINDKILKMMGRRMYKKEILNLITKLRKDIPGLVIRTTLIVGFPGESEKQFKELLDFMNEVKFERLGIFIYSREEGTPASSFPGQISLAEKKERLDRAMSLQQDISGAINRRLLGRRMEILVDEINTAEPGLVIGRSRSDAPEVDGQIFVTTGRRDIKPGDFLQVKIKDTYEYDLVGEEL